MDVEEIVEELYGLKPSEFTSVRDAYVAEALPNTLFVRAAERTSMVESGRPTRCAGIARPGRVPPNAPGRPLRLDVLERRSRVKWGSGTLAGYRKVTF
ncbi:hypothetical protein ACPB9E_35705 [Streptomyces exfoliatus]|uniref:hypothetical protein n=1 Tax=Streptomyces exfoliatus TaxID=1905 RepID=UPI003C30C2FB